MSEDLFDARGVLIKPDDTVIYGFGVSRSVAMAEGVVVAEGDGVSVTASGRVRVRVVRRSYGGGEKPVVDLAPDRIVVLKHNFPLDLITLPHSPLPTQDEANAAKLRETIARDEPELARLEAGGRLHPWQARRGFNEPDDYSPQNHHKWINYYRRSLPDDRAELAVIEERL